MGMPADPVRTLVQSTPALRGTASSSLPGEFADALPAGMRLHKFEVLWVIGQGGSGVVILAHGQLATKDYFERLTTVITVKDGDRRLQRRPTPGVARPLRDRARPALGRRTPHAQRHLPRELKARAHAETEQAFGKIVALGIANSSLGVKLMFNRRTTDSWCCEPPCTPGHPTVAAAARSARRR